MAKTIELNISNVKKYASIITVKAIIFSIISVGFFIVPIGETNIIQKIIGVFQGDEITTNFVICVLYFACICYSIISLWKKIVLFKNKTEINTETNAEILKSRFAIFEINDLSSAWIIFLHLAFYLYTSSYLDKDFSLIVPYMLYFLVYIIAYFVLNIMLTKLHRTFRELRMNTTLQMQAKMEAEKLGINTESTTQEDAQQPSMQDQKANLDTLVKYKQLYDAGAITEEEYNKKKAELLNTNK